MLELSYIRLRCIRDIGREPAQTFALPLEPPICPEPPDLNLIAMFCMRKTHHFSQLNSMGLNRLLKYFLRAQACRLECTLLDIRATIFGSWKLVVYGCLA